MAGVETPPYALQNASHGAQLFRLATMAWAGAVQPLTMTSPLRGPASGSTYIKGVNLSAPYAGVVGVSDFAITQNGTPNMTVNVAAGQVIIPGGSVAEQGSYYGLSDASTSLTISASSVSNPRIDTVIASVADSAYAGASNNWSLSVVTGTATAGATLSNLTGAGSLAAFPNCVVLGYVLVPANATTIVTADILNSQPMLGPGYTGLVDRGTPAGRLYANNTQTIGSATYTTLTGLVTDWLFGGMTTASNELIVPVAGLYLVQAVSTYNQTFGSTSLEAATGIYQNGGLIRQATTGGAVVDPGPFVGAIVKCAAGDTLQVATYQNSGSSIATVGGSAYNYIEAVLVGGVL